MPVFLTKSLKHEGKFDRAIHIGHADTTVTGSSPVLDSSTLLESAFDDIYDIWRTIALSLQAQPSAQLAHMPTMSTYASDFGVMLAWQRVIEKLCEAPESTLVYCSDPWLFRSLARLPNIQSGSAPSLLRKSATFWVRGYLARTKLCAQLVINKYKASKFLGNANPQEHWILVYGHPDSNAQGADAYFGSMLHDLPNLRRAMHTDCNATFAQKLAADNKTISLHAFGSIVSLLQLLWQKWRPDTSTIDPKYSWLVMRAAALEGSGGSAAMTTWQRTCHWSWLNSMRPKSVCWPWENHPWERDFVRKARRIGVKTYGYQHTVVGRHMFNQGADANIDGLESIPDKIFLNGPSYFDDLESRGIPKERMVIMGSHRIGKNQLPTHRQDGVVFLALSNNPSFAQQMMDAVRPLASRDLQFIVKAHPLNPHPIEESDFFTSTKAPLGSLPPLRALIYCTGTTGLEGLLAGIPTLRFIPNDGVALDILPSDMQVTPVSRSNIKQALLALPEVRALNVEQFFPPPDLKKWQAILETE